MFGVYRSVPCHFQRSESPATNREPLGVLASRLLTATRRYCDGLQAKA